MQNYVLTNRYKENLKSITCKDHKNKVTRVISYTCRYTSGHLIPVITGMHTELGIRCPFYTGVANCLSFLY